MGSSNIRVKVPDDQSAKRSSSISKATSHRRTGSNKFSYASVKNESKESEDEGSSSEEDFRSMRNRVKRN